MFIFASMTTSAIVRFRMTMSFEIFAGLIHSCLDRCSACIPQNLLEGFAHESYVLAREIER